jgi:hypothetical protein
MMMLIKLMMVVVVWCVRSALRVCLFFLLLLLSFLNHCVDYSLRTKANHMEHAKFLPLSRCHRPPDAEIIQTQDHPT